MTDIRLIISNIFFFSLKTKRIQNLEESEYSIFQFQRCRSHNFRINRWNLLLISRLFLKVINVASIVDAYPYLRLLYIFNCRLQKTQNTTYKHIDIIIFYDVFLVFIFRCYSSTDHISSFIIFSCNFKKIFRKTIYNLFNLIIFKMRPFGLLNLFFSREASPQSKVTSYVSIL